MDLRALLFTADGGTAAILCQILTELGIQAEICSEMLVASERISREPYDTIVVDWDHETEAAFLLKKAREQRIHSLNLALVPDDSAIGRALQQGANSVIKKPINTAQASDTLTTARDLILSRHAEQREKQARLSALEAEAEPLEEDPLEAPPAPRSGFLQQTMTPTALEAEQKVSKPQSPVESGWQAARGPAAIRENAEPEAPPAEPFPKKRWDEVKTIFRQEPEAEKEAAPEPAPTALHSHDATGVFSSATEDSEGEKLPEEEESSSPPQYLVFAVVACVLIAGVLYVWAPGDSYLGRMTSAFHAFSLKSRGNSEKPAPAPAPPPAKPEVPIAANKPEDLLMADPPAVSTDTDPSKIQIIETKSIPKAGSQQPPTDDPPPDSDQAKALAPAQAASVASAPDLPVATSVQPQADPAPVTTQEPDSSPAPVPPPARVPADTMPAPEPRSGVIIPDSLRTTPA
ncbi:MAG TPA: hypothetical protein VK466_08100, partial [Terriglobales bacterium]|nr:hypothetical protein [Terriglobales bacterium]